MKKSIKVYLIFLVYFELALYILFKLIHSVIPSTLIFDQILLISLLNTSLFVVYFKKKSKLEFDRVVAIISLGLFLMFLNQTFILNVDRSRSTFVLSWVDKGHISLDQSGNFVTHEISSNENLNASATVQRIKENIDRGLITVQDKKVRLTATGSFLLHVCDTTADLFNLKGWKVNSQ